MSFFISLFNERYLYLIEYFFLNKRIPRITVTNSANGIVNQIPFNPRSFGKQMIPKTIQMNPRLLAISTDFSASPIKVN